MTGDEVGTTTIAPDRAEVDDGQATVSLVCVLRGEGPGLRATLDSAVAEVGDALAWPLHLVTPAGWQPGEPVPAEVRLFADADPAAARAQAIAACAGDWVVVLSTDLDLAPGWGQAMSDAIARQPGANVLVPELVASGVRYRPTQTIDLLADKVVAALVKKAVFFGAEAPALAVVEQARVRRQSAALGHLTGSDWADTSDGVTIVLTGGGLGNQLLEFAAGLEQATRLDCPLYLDAHAYASEHFDTFVRETRVVRRGCSLFDYELPAIDITDASPWRDQRLPHDSLGNAMPAWLPVGTEIVLGSRSVEFVPVSDRVRPGSVMMGFFQHPRYFDTVLPRMLEMLSALRLTEPEQAFMDRLRADVRTTVHLRRGDYLAVSYEDDLGVASTDYARRAMAFLDRLEPGSRFRVYSDSPELVRADLEDGDVVVMAPDQDELRATALLDAMAESRNFVLSNSTISWWAAALVAHRDEDAAIVAPRPFHRNPLTPGNGLVLPDWFSLGSS